jgi:hypothetical protein
MTQGSAPMQMNPYAEFDASMVNGTYGAESGQPMYAAQGPGAPAPYTGGPPSGGGMSGLWDKYGDNVKKMASMVGQGQQQQSAAGSQYQFPQENDMLAGFGGQPAPVQSPLPELDYFMNVGGY